MRYTVNVLINILLICCCANNFVYGQSTVNTCGGWSRINGNLMIDWSFGESSVIDTYFGNLLYPTTIISSSWNCTSGVLQPIDARQIVSNSNSNSFLVSEVRAFPIPASSSITLDIRSKYIGKLSISLVDVLGTLHGQHEINLTNTIYHQNWSISSLSSGIYYFRLVLYDISGRVLKKGSITFFKS